MNLGAHPNKEPSVPQRSLQGLRLSMNFFTNNTTRYPAHATGLAREKPAKFAPVANMMALEATWSISLVCMESMQAFVYRLDTSLQKLQYG